MFCGLGREVNRSLWSRLGSELARSLRNHLVGTSFELDRSRDHGEWSSSEAFHA
jgi:hypothetical protein